MNLANKRAELPQAILSILPFLLFFPTGVRHIGVLLFILAVAASGRYREKWDAIRHSPLFWPAVAMLAVTSFAAVFLDRSAEKFWSGFAHYQIYLFLLLFISVGSGRWQRRAALVFIAGAIYGATLFYLAALGVLPEVKFFMYYQVYSTNKSILLGILLALAAGALLYEMAEGKAGARWWVAMAAFLYVSGALLFLAQTRTGALLLVLFSVLALVKAAYRSWHKALVLGVALVVALSAAWQFSPVLRARVLQTVADARDYVEKDKPSGQGIRFEIYEITSRIAAEKPLTGHGIGQWFPLYRERARGLDSHDMTTPHNEYLLYMTEIGLIGLAALLYMWLVQLSVAIRIGGRTGMHLGILTLSLMVGGMFNAILRDVVLGMPFMILLAIPLAGLRSPDRRLAAKAVTESMKTQTTR